MRLTLVNFMLRNPKVYPQSRWYKHEKLKEQAKHFRLRALRVRVGRVTERLRRSLVNQYYSRQIGPYFRNQLRNERLDAACSEHGVKPHLFKQGLGASDVKLSNAMLSILAIYEPRTFERLVELSQRANIESFHGIHGKLPERRLTAKPPKEKMTTGLF